MYIRIERLKLSLKLKKTRKYNLLAQKSNVNIKIKTPILPQKILYIFSISENEFQLLLS